MSLFQTIKSHILSNTRFPHPTLVGIAIGAAISAITVGIFYLADSGGLFGQDAVDAPARCGKMSRTLTGGMCQNQ